MAITENLYTGNGSTTNYSFTFPYISETDVKVSLDAVDTTAYTFANATTIQFNTAPADGVNIRIYRLTDDSELSAEFYSGSAIRAQDLNDNFTQNLYVTQEIANRAMLVDGTNPFVGDLDMGGFEVVNMAEPSSDTAAVNKQYVDSRLGDLDIPGFTRWTLTAVGGETTLSGAGTTGGTLAYSAGREQVFLNGAQQQRGVDYTADNGTSVVFNVALTAGDVVEVICVNNLNTGTTAQAQDVSFVQSGAGAVTRSVENKLQDVVSVKDFGAVGDGVTDDTAAFANARAEAKSTGKLLLAPVGDYLISGTVYPVTGSFVFSDDSFTMPINIGQQATNNSMLLVASTPDTTPIATNDGRVPISVSVETNGAQHGECYRGNLFNKSSDGQGNPAFYGKLVNYSTSGIGWAQYGETRHNGGTSIGIGVECAGYSTSGSMIGANIQNTTGSTPDTHPEDGSASDAQPSNSKAIQILGGAADLNKWAYGLYFNVNSVQSTGTGIEFSTANLNTGINFTAGTFSVAPIRLGDGQNITLEATNAIKFGYNSAASGGPAIEFNNGATANLRLYNSGVLDVLGSIRPATNDGSALGAGTRRFSEGHIKKVVLANSTNLAIQFGSGTPEGVVTGGIGSLYLRIDGGAGTALYVKESGTGNTGWVAK